MALEMEAPPATGATSGVVSLDGDNPEFTQDHRKLQPLASPPEPDEDFDWNTDDSVIITEQPATALYWNSREQLVIRQRGWPDDDSFVYFNRAMLPHLIEMLQADVAP